MKNQKREDVMRKVRHLLNLAERGGTVGESAAAAAAAQALMDKYELSRDEIKSDPENDEDELFDTRDGSEPVDQSGRLAVWQLVLVGGLINLHGCFVYTSHRDKGKSIEITGRKGSVETVRYMYAWLSRELRRLSKMHQAGHGAAWHREFKEGGASEIIRRLEEERRRMIEYAKMEAAGSTTALAKIDTAIARMTDTKTAKQYAFGKHQFGRATGFGGGNRQHRPDAREAGRRAAGSIHLGGGGKSLGSGRKMIGGGS